MKAHQHPSTLGPVVRLIVDTGYLSVRRQVLHNHWCKYAHSPAAGHPLLICCATKLNERASLFFFHPINHTARSHASHGLAAVDAPTTRNVPSDLSDESSYRAVRWSLVTQPCRLKGTRSLGLILWTRDTPRGGGSPRAEEVLCWS